MNRPSQPFPRRPAQRLLFAALLSLSLAGACNGSSDAPSTPITFDVEVATLDGNPPTGSVTLRCDHPGGNALSTLAVSVTITSTPADNFVLRPANACGASTRCGYVRIRALGADDQVLGKVDTATTSGVLELDPTRLSEVAKIQVSLIRGLDQQPLLNPDGSAVTAVVSPSFVAPGECADEVPGAGGASGAGGEDSQPPLGGAGGMAASQGGVGGEAGTSAGDGTALGGAAGAAVAGAGMGGA